MIGIFNEILSGCIGIVFSLAKIIIPLLILTEIMISYKILEKVSEKLNFVSKFLNISKQSVFPLIVGIFIGVTYGAGTIMEIKENGGISEKDIFLIGIFLFGCHGIIEAGFIFAALGVNPVVTVGIRFIIALLAVLLFSRIIMAKQKLEK